MLDAYAQLLAEGYVIGQVGSGTCVARALPEDTLHVRSSRPAHAASEAVPQARRALSRRGALLATTPVTLPSPERPNLQTSNRSTDSMRAGVGDAVVSFRPGQPAFDAFPAETWRKLADRCWRRPPRELLTYGDPAGYPPLREAIAEYLRAARAVRCEAEQVVIVNGSQQALGSS